MEIKVRDLGTTESKSVQEVEQQLLDEHQQQLEGTQEPPVEVVDEPTPTPAQTEEAELDDDKVLSYLGKRYGRELKSFDDLASQRDEQEDMDEEVKTYLK